MGSSRRGDTRDRLFTEAEDETKRLKDEFISVEHLLLAMTGDGGFTGRLFMDSGLSRERLMKALQEVRGNQRVTSQNPEATYEALERYGRDLTQLASAGKLDPVIGREREICGRRDLSSRPRRFRHTLRLRQRWTS